MLLALFFKVNRGRMFIMKKPLLSELTLREKSVKLHLDVFQILVLRI